ncbi:MAG: NYN domain-containing protein [Gammaproteobacteria bacterium]
MTLPKSSAKIGVYVDVANIVRNGGYGMHYDVLREFACRDGAEPLRLNAYVALDTERAREDAVYRDRTYAYYQILREFGFKVIEKEVRWFTDEGGNRYGKANSDLDMAVDALLQSENLDRVVLVTGDGDFTQVVRALQNKGLRVEVIAFDNVAAQLRREADSYISGYLIPGLIPNKHNSGNGERWGEIDSRIRGYCYHHDATKGFGFIRYMAHVGPGLWITDTRQPDSPYRTAFFHNSQLPEGFDPAQLPSRQIIFEFTLVDSGPDKDPGAVGIREVSRY